MSENRGDTRRLYFRRSEQLSHSPFEILARPNQLKNDVALHRVLGFEDLLLPSLRQGPNSGEIGEVLLKPSSGQLHLVIQDDDPDSAEAPRHTHSLNIHEA